jgi:hypothetical protein
MIGNPRFQILLAVEDAPTNLHVLRSAPAYAKAFQGSLRKPEETRCFRLR